MHRRVPPLDIFGDLRYFQKKFENLKNSFSRTSLTWNGTKSWILVTLAHLARKWQTGLWRPGQICPPLFQIGLSKVDISWIHPPTLVTCKFIREHGYQVNGLTLLDFKASICNVKHGLLFMCESNTKIWLRWVSFDQC